MFKSFENQLRGLELFLQNSVNTRECSRQTPCLDISQMNEDEELRLCINSNITKPSEFIGLWLICLAENPEWKELFRLELIERCKKNDFKNKWMDLFHLLKLNHLSTALWICLERSFSSRDLRGNILPKALKLWDGVIFKKIQKRKSKHPQFHRGYRDHGGRRLPHEVHDCSEVTGPNPNKFDSEKLINKKNHLLNFLYS